MKKILAVLLSAVIITQTGLIVAAALGTEDEKQTITISNVDTMKLAGEPDKSSTEIKAEGLSAGGIKIVSEDWTKISEFVISRKDIAIKGGKYSYRLVLRSNKTLTFDNDLQIYYQGVDGKYTLHYDIDETDNHTMIVTGVFDNIIIASPLLNRLSAGDREWILTHISKDSYFYQLLLKTKEGFSFMNTIQFMLDAYRYGYSVKYAYDLLTNRQTLVITDISDGSQSNTGAAAAEGTAAAQELAVSDEGSEARPVDQKADNPLAVKGETARIRYSKLKKESQTLDVNDVICFENRGKGKLTYTKVSGNSKITINKNTGDVTVGKGLQKGTYSVTVNVAAAGNTEYKASPVKTVTFKVIVN